MSSLSASKDRFMQAKRQVRSSAISPATLNRTFGSVAPVPVFGMLLMKRFLSGWGEVVVRGLEEDQLHQQLVCDDCTTVRNAPTVSFARYLALRTKRSWTACRHSPQGSRTISKSYSVGLARSPHANSTRFDLMGSSCTNGCRLRENLRRAGIVGCCPSQADHSDRIRSRR